MSLIDFILNVAALLLWVSWRYVPFDPISRATPATLTGTLRRAEPLRIRRWHFLAALIGLLLARAIFYWWIGGTLQWTMNIGLGVVSIAFRCDLLDRMLLFSFGSFASILFTFYLGLIFLSIVGPRNADADPCQRFVRIQLGRLHHWPWGVKVMLPFVIAVLVWVASEPLLARMQIIPRSGSWRHLIEQAVVLGLGIHPVLKHLIGAVLALKFLNTYVYLGSHPFWNFINATGKNLLWPLAAVPLRIGKMDLAPLVGIVLAYALALGAERGLSALLQKLPL
jgi:uncharacterized protein YggT (Ycf19 family)